MKEAWEFLKPQRLILNRQIGTARAESRRNNRHVNNLPPGPFERDLAMHISAVHAESAGMQYFTPCDWYTFGMKLGRAEICNFIDIKRIDEFDHRLIMQLDDDPNWAYVLCCAMLHPHYCLMGWQWGHAIQRLAPIRELQAGRPAYVLETYHLMAMNELREIQAERYAVRKKVITT